ncbi:MAG: nodulation protein NfeD [Chloroflexota bacterium]|nr:nodulation protein NfeD [Chloroflexota bacterium]
MRGVGAFTRAAPRAAAILLLALGCAGMAAAAVRAAGPGPVLVGHITGVINPITARYVDRLVGEAEERGAAAVVFIIDTPGGLIDSTYRITGRFLNARVPVVTYVAPSGARAASAGTFITMAGNVAAMAPATNIGAAHPVDSSGGDIQGDLRLKAENDAVAQITKIALARHRNASWAEDAVRKSVSIRDDEALRIGVVDVVAPDVDALLRAIDGRTVTLPAGDARLATAGAPVEDSPQSPLEAFLHLIVDPQIAVLLFTVGTYGLIFELANPGLVFPGIVGVIAIVLALFAFGTLDANAAGIALMLFAMGLFIADVKVTSHGLLTASGVIALVLGLIVLFPATRPTFPGLRYTVDPFTIALVVAVTGGFFVVLVRAALRFRHLPLASGTGILLGQTGDARSDLVPGGIVHVAGEDWSAVAEPGPIARGTRVRVMRVDGLRLIVAADATPTRGGGSP